MCPRCWRDTLSPTGGFWICSFCGLAITEQALQYERAGAIIRKASERTAPDEESVTAAAGSSRS
jgi:ribosomal protein L37AE/L43A